MDFLKFLDSCVTPAHTAGTLAGIFGEAGFSRLDLCSEFDLVPGGAYFAVRGSALVAFRVPESVSAASRFRIALAHTDFPALKVSPNPDCGKAGIKTVHPEVYGSPLFTSWLDRDLGYGGVLAFEKDGAVGTKVFRGKGLLRIPQLAVHLNRGVNQEGLKLDPQVDLNALWGESGIGDERFADALRRELGAGERLLDFDVRLFDAQPAAVGGLDGEWIYSGRLDNLSSCHAVVESIVASKPLEKDFQVAAFFNNEEVGSETREGAAGNFLRAVLEEVACRLPLASRLSAILAESCALSIDMAHAVHPNRPEKHEPNHAPILGGGIVLKTNSQMRYASDLESSARLRLLCERAGVALQTFVMRNDMPCGSTVGPAVSANLGIPTVDIGEPMLSMHSAREMTAKKDHQGMIRLVSAFFESGAQG